MLFTSFTFLFIFLPITILLHFAIPAKHRNVLLLIASTAFYLWGEPINGRVLYALIISNYAIALLLEKFKRNKFVFLSGLSINLATLLYFKYANFIICNLNIATTQLGINTLIATQAVSLPIGISFYIFHCISYLTDVYRGALQAERKIIDFALYNTLFPHLIAGPIVRYKEIAMELKARYISIDDLRIGSMIFIVGLAKKLIIANILGEVADEIMVLDHSELTTALAWLGILTYALQLYYDFSGYSDMAIGIARMCGFTFPQNFNYPYIASSIQDFWHRWHMTLSRWFKDYLYIPLGGNRSGNLRTFANLLVVFILCGLWHGASWNFMIWGLIHGLFLVLERTEFSRILKNLWKPLQHAYTLIIVLVSWVFFRIENLNDALHYLKAMFTFKASHSFSYLWFFIDREQIFVMLIAIATSLPILGIIRQPFKIHRNLQYLFYITLLCISLMQAAGNTYNPFIYFRF